MRKRNNTQALINPQDISLMTVIAFDSDSIPKAVNLLNQYGVEKPVSGADLEYKLSKLYFSVPDKIKLEKELALIHPHRKFLMKYMEPVIKEVPVEIPVPIAPIPAVTERVSSFDGSSGQSQSQNSKTENIILAAISLVAVASIVAITALSLQKSKS